MIKKRYIFLLITKIFLSGCQLHNKSPSAFQEIQGALQNASDDNAMVRKKYHQQLSEDVKKALTPNLDLYRGQPSVSVLEKRFDVVADQVPAKAFFLSLVEDTHYNITVHPNVEGKISLKLKKVTIGEVLETVRNVYGYDFRHTTQSIEILPATIQTRAFSVNYLDINRGGQSNTQVAAGVLKSGGSSNNTNNTSSAGNNASGANNNVESAVKSSINTVSKADFWSELKTAVETIIGTGEGRKVAISPLASLVVVQAMPDELRQVEEYLKNAELSLNRQVILEAKILEVELNDGFQSGINWGLINGRLSSVLAGSNTMSKGANLDGGNFPSLSLMQEVNVNPGAANSNVTKMAEFAGTMGGTFALAANFKNVGAFLDLLSAQGKVHVLSNPRVSTMNNQKALIKVGADRFFVTNVSTTTTTPAQGAGTTTPNVTFDSFFSGIALDVTPHITADNEITLHIHPTISDISDDTREVDTGAGVKKYPLAKSSVRESDSMVKARNGETVVIGGLMQNRNFDLKQGVPVLKDVPIVGGLFKQTVQKTKKSELVILLRPIIVNNHTQGEVIENTLDRFRKINGEMKKDEYQ